MRLPLSLVVILLLMILTAIPGDQVQANSAPPPGVVWLTFENQSGEPIQPEGVQITGCQEANCTLPVLLIQYGKCDQPGCLTSEEFLVSETGQVYLSFDCAENRCRATAFDFTYPLFGLVVQYSDGVRTLAAINPLPQMYGEELEWLVTVPNQPAQIQAVQHTQEETGPRKSFWLYLALTLCVELFVGATFFGLVQKEKGQKLGQLLVMIVLVNLLTFPVVWYCFPSWKHFVANAERNTGVAILLASIGFSILLWFVYHAQTRRKRNLLMIVGLIALPLAIFSVGIIYFVSSYGTSNLMYARGLPIWATILLAELYAFLWEAGMYWSLSKRELSLPRALTGSFLMNLASYVAGLLLILIQ